MSFDVIWKVQDEDDYDYNQFTIWWLVELEGVSF